MFTESRVKRRKRKTAVSRDIGLEIGWICGKYFFNMQHLHYGYWTADLPVNLANVHLAQANYVKFLMSHIPEGVKTILDVGCGTGQLARELKNAGYKVDCISPNAMFAERTRSLLGPESTIFECTFEQFSTDKRYDLVMFAESFQYIGAHNAINKSFDLLRDGGHLLICDYFAMPLPEKAGMSGGERWGRFTDVIAGSAFASVEDIDVTEQMAPTLDVVNDIFKEALLPTVTLATRLATDRHPWLTKLVTWIYRKRIAKINAKYFSGKTTGQTFKKCKSYRLLLYRKTGSAADRLPAVDQSASACTVE